MFKELANDMVQLEVKDSAYMEALLKIELYQKTVDELSSQLKNSKMLNYKYINDSREARPRILELETKKKAASFVPLEAEREQEQLLHPSNELSFSQAELINSMAGLGAAEESKLDGLKKLEHMETAANMEMGRTDEFLKHIAELNEASSLFPKLAEIEAEREQSVVLSENDTDIKSAMTMAVQVQKQLEEMRNQIMMQVLENQISANSMFIDSLQLEPRQAKELHMSSVRATSNGLNLPKSGLVLKEKVNCNQAIYMKLKERELNELRSDLENAKEEVNNLNYKVEILISEIQKTRDMMDDIRGTEAKSQVEIATLKRELHKERSKITAADAAEASAKSVKAGLVLAVKRLAIEGKEAKMKTESLKQEADKEMMDPGMSVRVNSRFDDLSEAIDPSQIEAKTEAQKHVDNGNSDDQVTISTKEYRSLVRKAEKANSVVASLLEDASPLITFGNKYGLDVLKKDVETATVEMKQLKSVADQAVKRAEMAEKAKAATEDQLRRLSEQKPPRRASLATIREEIACQEMDPPKLDKTHPTHLSLGKVHQEMDPPKSEKTQSTHVPLSKVLNIKF